jgi:UDP-N-acetylglucosamine enolpyruvyl transferase
LLQPELHKLELGGDNVGHRRQHEHGQKLAALGPDVKLINRNYVLLIMKDHERTVKPTQQKTL